jgi:acetolactate synthase-1/2/3 large subunit
VFPNITAPVIVHATDGPAVVEVRVDPSATPIHSYRRRLEQGGTHPRPGTVYQLPAWRRSPPSIDPPEGSTYSSA